MEKKKKVNAGRLEVQNFLCRKSPSLWGTKALLIINPPKETFSWLLETKKERFTLILLLLATENKLSILNIIYE